MGWLICKETNTVIERYRPLLESDEIQIDFVAVVDSKKREYSYTKAVERIIRQQSILQEKLIRRHTQILRNDLGVEPSKVDELPAKIRAKYSEVNDISEEDTSGIPMDEIQLDCMGTVKKLADDIISFKCKKEEKLSFITELFRKLYRISAAGILQNHPAYSIGVYRISYKFSIS